MAYGYIYKISTTESKKVYIGQTTRTVQQRFLLHLKAATRATASSSHLYLAINKYGSKTFSVEQIDFANSQDELNEKERYWINFYDSINNGYNMMEGGTDRNPMDSPIVKKHHAEKMSSYATRKKISETMRTLRATVGFSNEHKEKIKLARQKRKQERAEKNLNFYNHPEHFATRSIRVYCILDTGEKFYFNSILEAGKWWYKTYKPFGENYSIPTFQRKIEASIRGEEITFGIKSKPTCIKITNIKWFLLNETGGDAK